MSLARTVTLEMPIAKRARRSKSSSKRQPRAKLSTLKNAWPFKNQYSSPYADPFPAVQFAKLRYSEVITFDAPSGAPVHYLFRANSINDPNRTGTGHQPYGHDVYAQIYNHYAVQKAICTVTTVQSNNGIFGVTQTDDVTVQNNYDIVREVKGTQYACIASNGGDVKRIMSTYDRTKTWDGEQKYATSALMGTDPAEVTYFDIWYEGYNFSQNPGPISLLVTITYMVKLFEPKDLGPT